MSPAPARPQPGQTLVRQPRPVSRAVVLIRFVILAPLAGAVFFGMQAQRALALLQEKGHLYRVIITANHILSHLQYLETAQ